MYKIAKFVSGKSRGATDTPIVDKQDNQEVGWAEHFNEVLNRTPQKIEVKVPDPDTEVNGEDVPTTNKIYLPC